MRRAWIGAGGLLAAALVAVEGAPGAVVTRTPDDVAAGISLQQSASARIEADGKTIYFDPFFDDKTPAPPADLILITHAHDRHCSAPTILRILKADTAIVAPEGCARLLRETRAESITTPVPGKALRIAGFTVESVSAYTPDHADHPLAAGGVGYVLTIVALIAFWNGYILSTDDAATLARSLGAKIVIPIHCKPEEAVKLRDALQPAIRVVLQDQPPS
jgi:L-ascorbate metabolism protein UlaG (beta-lactamase superfamily)